MLALIVGAVALLDADQPLIGILQQSDRCFDIAKGRVCVENLDHRVILDPGKQPDDVLAGRGVHSPTLAREPPR